MGLALGLLSNLIGGSTYLVTKLALAGLPPATLILVRTLVALIFFAFALSREPIAHDAGGRPGLFARLRAPFARATRGDALRIIVMGTLGLGLPHIISATGLQETESLSGALLVGLEPITIVLSSALFLGERMRGAQVLGIVFGAIGATLVVSRGELSLGAFEGRTRGTALVALASVLWGIYTIAAKPTLDRVSPRALTAVASLISLTFVLPFSVREWSTIDPARALSPQPLAAALALGVFVSFGSASLWNAALQKMSPSEMAALIFVQPVAGSLVAYFAGEPLPRVALAGGALVLFGVYLAERRRPAPRPAVQDVATKLAAGGPKA